MKNEINIVMAINEKYIMPARTTIASIKTNKGDELVNIYIMHFNISDYGVTLLEGDSNNSISVKCIRIEEEEIPNFEVYYEFSKEIMIKLFTYKFLPLDIDKVLWLDCDLIVLKSLKSLFEKNIDNYYFLAYEDQKVRNSYLDRINFKGKNKYFNVGVLLINLNKIRSNIKYSNLIEKCISNSKVKYEFTEQDVANILFNDDSLVLGCPYEYNRFVDTIYTNEIDKQGIKILHYQGFHQKPWKGCAPRHYLLWWKYAKTIKEYRKDYWKIMPVYFKSLFLKVINKFLLMTGIKKVTK